MIVLDGDIGIRRMRDDEDDYSKMREWCSREHVKDTYSETEKSYEEIVEKYSVRTRGETDITPAFIVYKGRDIGYIQFYPVDEEEYMLKGRYSLDGYEDPYGIDVFIGEEELIGKGIGSKAVEMLSDYLLYKAGADIVLIDPAADNKRAVAAYKKAGFREMTVLHQREVFRGECRDNLLMAKIRKE